MAKFEALWKPALTPQKAPTYGNQAMLIASPKELQVSNVDYVVVFEGTKKYHVAIAEVVNPYTLHVVIPEHDIAEEVAVNVYICQDNNLSILIHLKFTYISQMEHAIAKFLAHSASDTEVAEKLDAVWTVCLGKDHLELWDKRLAQAFAQLELPFEWTLVGDILQKENESQETLLHFAAHHGLKELINVFLDLPGAKRALSTCDKSGLLPRDVARENGRLDLVELLDADRSTDQRKSGTFKDTSRRKVRRNNDSGVTTITNLRNHNIQEDIQILRELNKLKAKRNSPVNRHSWPVNIQSFNPDDYSMEDLDEAFNKARAHGDASTAKRSFLDDNLIRLRDITEEICNLRTRNAEETSKEASIIAAQNRRPAHSRRLSCPASVERRKRAVQGLQNLQCRPDSSASERSQGKQDEPAGAELVFSTPPHSPTVGMLVDLSSPTVTSPGVEDSFPQFDDVPESFMTPLSSSPTSSPLPPSPLPISLKYSDVERRPNASRKNRPRTWYGGGSGDAPPEDDEQFRRSNSLEDFAKALEDVSDDESATSDANSKENLLQTMCSLTEKASRTESFVSSISESVGSDCGSEPGDDCEHEDTPGGIEDGTSENLKDNEEHEGIREGRGTQEDDGHKETEDENVGVHDGIWEGKDTDEQRDTEAHERIEDSNREHEGTTEQEGIGEVGENKTLIQTAGSNESFEDEYKDAEDIEHDYRDPDEHGSVEQNEDTEASADIHEDSLSREGMDEDRQDDEDKPEFAEGQANDMDTRDYNGQQGNEELDTSIVCNGHVEERGDTEGHVCDQDEEARSENEGGDSMEKNAAEDVTNEQSGYDGDLGVHEMIYDEEADQYEAPGPEPVQERTPGDLEVTQDLVGDTGIAKNQLSLEDIPMANLSEEPNLAESFSEAAAVVDQLDVDDLPEGTEDSPECNESDPKETEDQLDECEVRTDETGEKTGDHLPESEDLPTESEDTPEDCGKRANVTEVGPHDAEETDDSLYVSHTKIQFKDINDIECEVKDFCLPGQNTERKKELFRVSASEDIESGEDSDPGRHIRFDEKARSASPLMAEERPPENGPEDEFSGGNFRQRSALLLGAKLGVKAPVKRTGSNTSVTSLQDVQLDIHTGLRKGDISPGVLNNSRKAKSFGDLSTFTEGRSEMTKVDDDDESEDERRRIQEDQAQLHSVHNRVKKFENASKYASNERLEEISSSRVIAEREDEEKGQRRWSNFFYNKNPKPGKKPGRTPTFRRDVLRSSMSSIGKSAKGSGKSTIETLVTGPSSAAFAKHSQTAPNLHVATNRPRSNTKDSPGSARKSPTVVPLDAEEQKPESPEEVEIPSEDLDLDVDSDLENFDQEPEAWSVTVEKKVLKKMSKNDIKRQDVIMELIKTEGHHVRTLKIMQQVFYRGLNKLANYPAERLDELFPRINDLVDLSSRFYRNLRCRQDESAAVQKIGDVIVRQFSGDNGELVMQAYGEFVSKHPEAVALYKHNFKTDKKFANFIKKCHGHRIVRRLSVPECFTLVTQRMTKYPLLIEAILKVTKSSYHDHKELQKALYLVKDATKAVDNAIKDYEKQSRLKDIKMRTEKGSVVLKTGLKIKNSRFIEYQSKMIHDGILQWKNARGKLTETHVVLLESMVAFLQENDKKFSLLAIDGKSPCIALNTLMVREVATDKCAIYFVSTSKKGPEMYEFVCASQKEKRQWFSVITDAITKAPEDTGDLFHSPEEEKRLSEERLKRRNELLEIMKGKDKELSDLVEEKNKLVAEMKELWQMPDGNEKVKEDERISSNEKARSILLSAIHRTTQLTADTVLLHESHSDSELAAATEDKKASSPKRAETFGGFDRRPSQKTSRRLTTAIPEGKPEENHVGQRRDSGLSSLASESVVGLHALSHGQEVAENSSFQILESLQWVLVQFSLQETALETIRAELQTTTEEVKQLRSVKHENDKKQFLMKEEHQAELTRQKKAYNDLERTFNTQVSDLKLKLKSQQEQQELLLKNFSELRIAITKNR